MKRLVLAGLATCLTVAAIAQTTFEQGDKIRYLPEGWHSIYSWPAGTNPNTISIIDGETGEGFSYAPGELLLSETPVDPPVDPPVEPIPWKLVYSRQPRASTPVPNSPIEEAASWQHKSDIGRINWGLSELDTVIDDLEGNVKVIYDCTTSDEICIAQEARVSPDGTKIALSVATGNALSEVWKYGYPLGIYEISRLSSATIWIYDLRTDEKWPVPNHPAGAIDRQPEWIDNETIVFTTNREGVFPHKTQFSQHRGHREDGSPRWNGAPYGVAQPYDNNIQGDAAAMAMQVWRMKIDGTEAVNLTPHEYMATSPTVTTTGDILYSCWNGHSNEAFEYNRNTSNPGTEVNKWWLCHMKTDGTEGNAIIAGHPYEPLKTRDWLPSYIIGGEGSARLRGMRSVQEIRKGYMAFSAYYRSNHVGSQGIVYGFTLGDPSVEGVSRMSNYTYRQMGDSDREGSGRYVPSDLLALTPVGNDQDNYNRWDDRTTPNRMVGKFGFSQSLPNTDDWMVTYSRGYCYEVQRAEEATRAFTGGEPTCDQDIMQVHDQVVDVFDTDDMSCMVCSEDYHEFDADYITTFDAQWGQEIPDVPDTQWNDDGKCYIQSVNVLNAELKPRDAVYDWQTNLYAQCSEQGCGVKTEDDNFHKSQLKYIVINEIEPWTFSYAGATKEQFGDVSNNTGHYRLGVWGWQAPEEDGSLRMEVPCETPIQISGADDKGGNDWEMGSIIAHDDRLHSLRRNAEGKGETRTCWGCHDGHSEERSEELKAEHGDVHTAFSKTLAAKTNPPTPDNGFRVTFKDLLPVMDKHCVSCHVELVDPDGLLYSKMAWDWEQLDFPEADRVHVATGDYKLSRPYTSKYAPKLGRNSLLYWKCMGSRMDGRTDDSYPNDIDYGEEHPAFPQAVCTIFSRWIDQGVQNK